VSIAQGSRDQRSGTVNRRPPSGEGSVVGAHRVEGLEGWRYGPQSHVGNAVHYQEGRGGLEGGGELQAKPLGVALRTLALGR
jgi:hypothetical protein